ncbi:unnamed protein product [Closterium sp. Yama58-4]|nr:unnamed protein product [Closterium sp. Yama58-4]
MAPSLLRIAPRFTPTASSHPARSLAPSRAARGGSSTSASRAWLRRSISASCVALLLLLLTASLLRARIRPQSPEGGAGSGEGERPLRVYVVLLPAPYNVDLIPLAQVTRAPRGPSLIVSLSPGPTSWPSPPWRRWLDSPCRTPLLPTPLSLSPPTSFFPHFIPHLPPPFPCAPPLEGAQSLLPPAALSSSAAPSPPCTVRLHSPHAVPLSWLHSPSPPSPSSASSASSLPAVASPASGSSGGSAALSTHLLPFLATPDLPDLPVPLSPSPPPSAAAAAWEAAGERAAVAGTDGAVDVSVPCYPDYPYFRQHGAEYFLTLSLLAGTAAVQRVQRVEDAEVVFVPYWSTLAFRTNASEILDPIIARFARRHAATLASSAANATHGSGGSSESTGSESTGSESTGSESTGSSSSSSGREAGRMPPLVVPCVYPLAMFNHSLPLAAAIKLAVDLDLHWPQAASYDGDVIVPYVPLVPPFSHDSGAWAHRPLLLFFQGTTDRWGQVQRELQGQPGVQFTVGRADNSSMTAQATNTMRRAKYCLVPRGDTSSSCCLFDAILSGCIPVIISDALDPPFEDVIDYTAFALLIPAALAVRPGYILGMLHAQTEAVWRQQWQAMRKRTWCGGPWRGG